MSDLGDIVEDNFSSAMAQYLCHQKQEIGYHHTSLSIQKSFLPHADLPVQGSVQSDQ